MTNIEVLIVEDEPIIAEDLAGYLQEKGYEVLEPCYTYLSALSSLRERTPDICLLDINLGKGMEGFDIARFINEEKQIPFLFLTSYSDRATVDRAKQFYPMGYISKPLHLETVFTTIEIALFNFSNKFLQSGLSIERINNNNHSPLTSKEFEVLEEIYQGKNNQQISQKHFISLNTVKTHIKRIYDKMDVHSRAEMIAKIRFLIQ